MPPLARRGFLRAAALAPLAAPAAAARAPANLAPPRGVQLAAATICADGFANRRHGPALRALPQAGFTRVELNLWYPDVLTPAYLDDLGARCAAAGLEPVCVQGTAFGGEGPGGVLKDVAHKLWLLDAARRLGCRRVKCTGAARGTQGGLPAVIEVCREVAPAYEAAGALLLLENHAQNVLEFPADYDAVFAAVDSPSVALCLDTAHFLGSGVRLAEVVERFHARTRHVDLKDNAGFGGGHAVVMYGEGVADFDAFLADLLGRGYAGILLVEMAHATPREPVVENLRRARERFARYERA